MTSYFNYDTCMNVYWEEESDEFTIDKGWIAGAFLLGLLVGGLLAGVLMPIVLRDWEKKKKQDEEETMLMELDREDSMPVAATTEVKRADEDDDIGGKKGGFFRRKSSKKGSVKKGSTDNEQKKEKGWVVPEDDDKKDKKFTSTGGMGVVLTQKSSGDADAELTKQDMDEVVSMDRRQKEAKDDMSLKMLKIKLRKMKSKGQMQDSYLADLTGKILEKRKGNKDMLNLERQDAEDELRRKHGKNQAGLNSDMDDLQVRLDAKQRQSEKDELDFIRGELLRTSGLSESEVDDLMEKLKQDLANLERKQGLEQARQARHLAERLEKRRHILEFRRLQEQQSKDELVDNVKAMDKPLKDLVDDGKLAEKQKKELLDEHQRNLQNLQKQHELDALRVQQDLAEKLKQRREARMNKLNDKQSKEKAAFLSRAEKSTDTEDFMTNYQELLLHHEQENEAVQTELDQSEIQELEKVNKDLDRKRTNEIQTQTDNMTQKVSQMGQVDSSDVKQIMRQHNANMDALEAKRRDERERMKMKLQERWQQKINTLEEDQQNDMAEREAIVEQQDAMVKRVLSSNLELTEEARKKVLQEHENNMVALNNQMARSKVKQQMALEHKLSQRRAKLADLKAQQASLEDHQAPEKEIKQVQAQLDQEAALLEKERKEEENNLRKRLALETETALAQQERDLAGLMGRLEVGRARRQAMLQKQDKTLKELQDQLEKKLETGQVQGNWADQIIQQHYNQVEHVNDSIQANRERQEQLIAEKLQAKKLQKQRELDDKLAQENHELATIRRQSGATNASSILNTLLMQNRQKKAMDELEREMAIELEKNKEQLNDELQKSLEKELENHKEQFLHQLAAASNISQKDIHEMATSASKGTGSDRRTAKRMSKDLQLGLEKARSSLGMIEEDSDSYDDYRGTGTRPYSSTRRSSEDSIPHGRGRKKPKRISSPPKPAFQTSTGEQIHGAWDMDDDDLL